MNSRKYLEERRQKRVRQNRFLGLMIGGGVLLVFAAVVYAIVTSSRVNLPARLIVEPEFTEIEQFDISSLGEPQAPVVIEEFSDFSCSHCADFALETKKLIEENYINSGQASLVFSTVGNLAGSPALQQSIEGAYCAGEQGSFWQFHDLIFANQIRLFTNRAADVSRTMVSFAEILELDQIDFEICLEEEKYQALVLENQQRASQLGVSGTPTFFINGVMVRGNQPFESFQQVIEEALAAGN